MHDDAGLLEYVGTPAALPRCAVSGCTRPPAERHHWAPRAIFGSACEAWPTALLCVVCHATWHRRVTPDLWRLRLQAIATRKARA